MANASRFLFFFLVMKPLAFLILGLNVRRRNLLPRKGPAIIVANHNSHLDTVILLALLPYRVAMKVSPVGAESYFFRNRFLACFSRNILGIVPVDGKHCASAAGMLRSVSGVLAEGGIVLIFPEGTRGEPERMGRLHPGIAHILKPHPEAPVIPVFIHGAGKALPRGESILVPFLCDVLVGNQLFWTGNRTGFMDQLASSFRQLAIEGGFHEW